MRWQRGNAQAIHVVVHTKSGDFCRHRRSERGHVGSSQSDVGRAGRICDGAHVNGYAVRDDAR